jgi:amylosucrase
VHRPKADAARYAFRHSEERVEGKVYSGMRRIIQARKANLVFAGGEMQVVDSGSESVFAYLLSHKSQRALVLANFSEDSQLVPANLLRLYGLSYQFNELLSGRQIPAQDLVLGPYEVVALQGD